MLSDAEAGSSSDESLAAEYRPHVKARELNDDWEEEVDDECYNKAKGATPDLAKCPLVPFMQVFLLFLLPASLFHAEISSQVQQDHSL